MNFAVVLGFAAATAGFGLAVASLLSGRRTISQWSFSVGMIALAAEALCNAFSFQASLVDNLTYWQSNRLVASSFVPGAWLLFSLSYSRGNYRQFLLKWRLLLVTAFAVPALLILLAHGELVRDIRPSASAAGWFISLGWPALALNVLVLLGAAFVLMNLERTLRACVGTMRWRIKFMLLGLGMLFAVRIYTCSQTLVSAGFDLSSQILDTTATVLACGLTAVSLLREGLTNVDVYPSRSFLQNSLTVLAVGLYLMVVGVFGKFVTILGGNAGLSLKTFMVLTAVVLLIGLLLSDRVRRQIRRFLSRHLQRPRHDYRQAWATLAGRTASLVDVPDLCRETAKWVSETFDVLSVTVWLVDEPSGQILYGASTSLSEADAARRLESHDCRVLVEAVRLELYPFDLGAIRHGWGNTLRAWSSASFWKGGSTICVPLRAGGDLMGLMTVGDRVSGVPFSFEDTDFLKSIGDQLGASLRSAQLSHKVLQAKELAAFQTMSAFFVHDLKNTAATLSLILQNLPAHFDDPAFREDALRSLNKSVGHINALIGRLGFLREECAAARIHADLNEVVNRALSVLPRPPRLTLTKLLGDSLNVHIVPDQIEKVITNVALNALEAVGDEGHIHLETSQRNGFVVLSVTDSGCGMSPEFVRKSLFRPFQTTKKKGIGIGMFLSKTIVEAHNGRIEVESEPGKGTTVRILLPPAGEVR